MQRLLVSCLAASLLCLPATAKPKATHPPVDKHHAHSAPARQPHDAPHRKAPHPDLAYKPKKAKHFKIAKP